MRRRSASKKKGTVNQRQDCPNSTTDSIRLGGHVDGDDDLLSGKAGPATGLEKELPVVVTEVELTKPGVNKQSIREYYASKGNDYERVRQNCKIPLGHRGNRNGGISLDFYRAPEGYTEDELPEPNPVKQQEEPTVSPAVLLALKRNQGKRRPAPEHNTDKFTSEMLLKLQRQKAGKENHHSNAVTVTTSSETENETREREMDNSSKEENVEVDTETDATLHDTFPDDDDLILIAVVKQEKGSDDVNADNHENPLTSTPITIHKKSKTEEGTPRTTRRIEGGSLNKRSLYKEIPPPSNLFLSPATNGNRCTRVKDAGCSKAPMKIPKFDESPVRGDGSYKYGDFGEDDGNDEFLSQIEMSNAIPVESEPDKPELVDSKNYDTSTQLICMDDTLSDYITLEDMDAIAALENINGS